MKNDFISVFWAWNGDLNKEVIKNQLTDFASKGISDVFAHARAGLKVPYMGEEWLNAFAYAIEVAKEVGIKVWIYDENGWPSGFGGGKVYEKDDSFKQRYLLKKTFTAKELAESGISTEDIIGIYSFDGVKLKKFKLKSISKSDKNFEVIYVHKNDFYVDITNPDAINYFIKTTHEVYKERFSEYFGNVIPGVFTDEPHVSPEGMPYGRFIIDAYENTYGESIVKAIENVFFDLEGAELYRYRYRKVLTKLIYSNYSKKCNDWCVANGLIFTGHYANEEGLASEVSATGSVMPLYPQMGLMGVDALGNRLIPAVAYKQVASVSRQFGDGNILCETYAGTGYDSSFKELLRIWSYQAIHGITHLCASISMMSLEGNRKRDYPQFFSEQMPWWEKSDELFKNIKFINNNIGSQRLGEVLVVFPMSGMHALYGCKIDDRVLSHTTSLRNLTEALLSAQVDFDFGEEDMIANLAVVKDKKLVLGKAEYSTVIVAENPNMESKVLEKLKDFATRGGKVIFAGKFPQLTDGKNIKPNIDFEFDKIAIRADYIRKYVQAYLMDEICIMEPMERKLSNLFEVTKRLCDGELRYTVLNKSRSNNAMGRIVVNGKKKIKEISIDGARELFGVYDSICDKSEFNIDLSGLSYAIYAVTDGEPKAENCYKTTETYIYPTNLSCSFNTFTIDKASISVDGEKFDSAEYVLNKTGKLYSKINSKGETIVRVKYTFNKLGKTGKLYISAETGGGKAYLNGNSLSSAEKSFYSDATRFEITDFVKDGLNEFVLEINMPPYYNKLLGKEVFQSVMNVFSFPYYVESVYLEGEFSVESNLLSMSTHVVAPSEFLITGPKKVCGGDLTLEGMPFFSGKVVAEYDLKNIEKSDKIKISIGESYACFAELDVNGTKISVISDRDIDVKELLTGKKDKITLTLYSSIRNLFGPHHHIYGKHYYTGPSVFEGYAEWQDAVIYPELKGNTYVDNYSFVHFIVPELKIKYFKIDK